MKSCGSECTPPPLPLTIVLGDTGLAALGLVQQRTVRGMELESCQNLTHTQNMFYSRPTIHKQTECGLQIQNIIHKLMLFDLQIIKCFKNLQNT